MRRTQPYSGAPLQVRLAILRAERSDRLARLAQTSSVARGYTSTDTFIRGASPVRLTGTAHFTEDPFRGLQGIELLRAIRGAVESKKKHLEYSQAHHLLFETIDNVNGSVTCIYTGRVRQGRDTPDPTDMNVEHIWPQSRGAKGVAKSDLHNLMVADSKANGERGNYHYGIVKTPEWSRGGSSRGLDASGQMLFTPRPEARGRIARATFYFATVYGFAIDAKEEALLRTWHKMYPPDAAEIERNRLATQMQGSPNYFILYPELVDRIPSFPKDPRSAVAA